MHSRDLTFQVCLNCIMTLMHAELLMGFKRRTGDEVNLSLLKGQMV